MTEPIRFAPCPENRFMEHIREYYDRAKERCPKIEAIYGKWRFEDLIPGMSDFDTRFILADDTTPEDWVAVSRAVGEVHSAICREHPNRARILEHLPGINLTWKETRDTAFYYPEYHQWSAYFGDREKIDAFDTYLGTLSWSGADELFCVKKYALYFTPYDRSIDPPINLHEFESKYPLHSRFMHYFCPPVQCAVSLREKRLVKGKAESLRLARELFPGGDVIDLIFEAVDRHYETPELYEEPRLTELENRLFDYLTEVWRQIAPSVTVVDASPDDTSTVLKRKLGTLKTGALARFFEGAKFCRCMMGRLLFYAEDIPSFDSAWLIGHELRRIRKMFFETTFTAFARIVWDTDMSAEAALERCRGEFLDEADFHAVSVFAGIFATSYDAADMKRFAVKVAGTMGDFQIVLEKMSATARRLAEEKGVD